jgi:cyclic dehypoxanthinyl futalosine synthase
MERKALTEKVYRGDRIDRNDALELFDWDLPALAMAADARRRMVYPDDTVAFIIDRIVNYTNVCEASCRFCAYHVRPGGRNSYVMTHDEILRRVEELAALGGSQVMLQGGLHPGLPIDDLCGMLGLIRGRYPGIALHCFSPAETAHIARKSGITIDDAIGRMAAAGLDSMPGASDLLVDRVRSAVSPRKLSRDEWREVMRALAGRGLPSSATMTYGMGESLAERVEHLEFVRSVQDETGIIRVFIPWSFSPPRTAMDYIAPATGMEYLKIVAISRIYLDNVRYMQTGWLTEGMKLAQLALAAGANDMGGIVMEELVVRSTGAGNETSAPQMIDVIRNAGRIPARRDSSYRIIETFA